MAFIISLLAVFQLSVVAFSNVSGDKLLVKTIAGDVRGDERELNGTRYRVFAGIPYAEPPVGLLRFAAPIAKTSWDEFNATAYGPSCPQDNKPFAGLLPPYFPRNSSQALQTNESCLTLNIYTPYPSSDNGTTDSSWAVMVWLHGGSYRNGKGSAFDASTLALKGEIIVVSMNYRVGPLGFLYTGDENAPGNYGLMDQQLALRWVQDNIEAFGGDPSRVTLSGQAGVHGSATLHMYAKDSQQLFHRVVAHSGVFQYEDLQESADAISDTKFFAELANCPNGDSSNLVECLRGKDVIEILDYNHELFKQKKFSYVWRPVSTRAFFTEQPGGSLYNLLSVFNSGDGSIALELIQDMFPDKELNLTKGVTEEQWGKWLDMYVDSPDVIDKAVERQYIDADITDKNIARLQALVNIQSARDYIRYGSVPLSELQSLLPSTHVMIFDHRSSADDRFPGLSLVPHGSELPYIFGLPFDESLGFGALFTDEERALSHRMIRYWSNFVKTGNPNMNEGGGNSWPEYGDSEKYLTIQLQDAEVAEEYRSNEIYFWNEYLKVLQAAADDVCPALPKTEAPGECKEPVIGKGLGLALDLEQTETLIEAFIFTCIALGCICIILVGAACGYKYRAVVESEEKTDEEHGDATKMGVIGEVNRGLLEDEEARTSGSSSSERNNPTPLKDKDDCTEVNERPDTPVYANVVHHAINYGEDGPPEYNSEKDEVDIDEIFPPPPEDLDDEDTKLAPAEDEIEDPPPPPQDNQDDDVDDPGVPQPPDSMEDSDLSDEFSDLEAGTPPPPDDMGSTTAAEETQLADDAKANAPEDFHSLNRSQSSQLYDRIMDSMPK